MIQELINNRIKELNSSIESINSVEKRFSSLTNEAKLAFNLHACFCPHCNDIFVFDEDRHCVQKYKQTASRILDYVTYKDAINTITHIGNLVKKK